ncbi:MAG: YerC/YecD family TrpR-related protein [Eggerthellaceae bacterium]|jgi:TrpR-related protein YerC/YecD
MAQLRTTEVDDLLDVLSGMRDQDEIFALLEDLMTIREIKEISQRLAVAHMLDEGKPYTAIEKTTGASATTIARVSKALNYGAGGYRRALEVLANRDAGQA